MKLGNRRLMLWIISHGIAIAIGFVLGVYFLPILIAPQSPPASELSAQAATALYSGTFRRDLKDSDLLHWGEGVVSIGARDITFVGKLAPGPDYKLYLSPEFVETEADFKRLKDRMVRVGDVKTFENFMVALPNTVDPAQYTAVIIWCEAFSQFITAASYQKVG